MYVENAGNENWNPDPFCYQGLMGQDQLFITFHLQSYKENNTWMPVNKTHRNWSMYFLCHLGVNCFCLNCWGGLCAGEVGGGSSRGLQCPTRKKCPFVLLNFATFWSISFVLEIEKELFEHLFLDDLLQGQFNSFCPFILFLSVLFSSCDKNTAAKWRQKAEPESNSLILLQNNLRREQKLAAHTLA